MRTHLSRGMTLIEVVISAAIFSTLMAMVAQSMIAAGRSSEVMAAKDDVTEVGGRVVHNLAFDLRDLALNANGTIRFTGPVQSSATTVQYTYRIATGVATTAQPYGLTYTGACDHDLVWDKARGTLTQYDYNADDPTVLRQSTLLASNILPPYNAAANVGDARYPNGGFTITANGRLLDVTLVLRRGSTFEGNQSEQWVAEQSAVFVRSTLANAWGAQSNMSSGSNTTSNPSALPPVITSSNHASGVSGQPFSYQIVATNSPTKYGVSGTLPSGLAISPATGLLSGTPTVTPSQTSFPLTLSAINAAGTGTASLTLDFTTSTQQGPNVPVVTGDTVTAQLGASFTYAISATNMAARYHPVSYGATGLPPGLGINVSSGAISGTPTQIGSWTAQISATNTDGTGTNSLSITVPNPPPPATPVVTGGSVQATVGTAFQYQISATHMTTADQPQGYQASNLPSGLSCDRTSGAITGTPLQAGAWAVTLDATNGGGTGTSWLTITVNAPTPSNTPVVTGATVNGTVGTPLVYTISATNMTSTYYNGHNGYSTSGMPGGLNQGNGFNQNTGTFQGTPSVAGTFIDTVSAANSYGTGSNQITFVIAAQPATPTPVVTSQSLATQQYASFTYQISATNMSLQYSPSGYGATGLPAGLSFAAATGIISGTPTASGSFAIQLSATNGGGTGTGTLMLTISAQSAPVPQVTGGSTSGQQTAAFSYQIQATNASSSYSPVSYAATGLPAGLSCSASTGLITGTPTVSGSFNATLTVRNSYGPGTAALMITIAAPPTSPPVVSSTAQTIYKGVAASYTASATNMTTADGPAGYAASGMPTGFTCDATTGTISGTATATGTYSVTIRATNRAGSGTGTLTLSVVDLPTISFAPTKVTSTVGNGNNANVNVAGSKVTVSAPTNYTLSGNPSVTASSNNLHYSFSSNSTGGIDVNFTGTLASGASATVSATATRAGYPTITGSYTIQF